MDIALKSYHDTKNMGTLPNPYIFSSKNWILHELGVYFYKSGKTEPKGAKMSIGYSVKASDMLFKVTFDKQSVGFERIN